MFGGELYSPPSVFREYLPSWLFGTAPNGPASKDLAESAAKLNINGESGRTQTDTNRADVENGVNNNHASLNVASKTIVDVWP